MVVKPYLQQTLTVTAAVKPYVTRFRRSFDLKLSISVQDDSTITAQLRCGINDGDSEATDLARDKVVRKGIKLERAFCLVLRGEVIISMARTSN